MGVSVQDKKIKLNMNDKSNKAHNNVHITGKVYLLIDYITAFCPYPVTPSACEGTCMPNALRYTSTDCQPPAIAPLTP